VWDPSARGAHRISVRIRDAEAEKDGEEVAVEAAVPSEVKYFRLCAFPM
jgi:nuclear pore complex protein Nup88